MVVDDRDGQKERIAASSGIYGNADSPCASTRMGFTGREMFEQPKAPGRAQVGEDPRRTILKWRLQSEEIR